MIAGLEDELGFKLFERQQGKLTPRPEARFFLEECDDILSRLEQTKRTLSGILNRPVFTGGQNSRRIARYGTCTKEEDLEAVFT
jgi:DNA-binding transcriptional LysR family regulator